MGEFKHAAITTHLGFVLEQNHMIIALSSFSKSFAQMFFFNTKIASYADVLTGSSRNHSSPRGEEWLRDEPVRTSA